MPKPYDKALPDEPAGRGEDFDDAFAAAQQQLGATPAPREEVSGFEMLADGLWRETFDRSGKSSAKFHVAGPFEVAAKGRDADSEGWGLLLRWRDRDRVQHEWFMPMAMLAGEAAELRARLQSGGLFISPQRGARDALLEYLARQEPPATVRTTPSIGWLRGRDGGWAFVLPERVFGQVQRERVVLTGDMRAARQRFAQRGTLEGWRRRVAALCVGNSRLAFAVSLAFAAALLTPMDQQTGAVNLRGRAQIGKSSAAKAAGSVWGAPEGRGSYVLRWRASDNGLEAMAADFNDCPMILDELGQADVRSLGEAIYMLANEQGKLRASRSAEARQAASWRLLVLSTGEKTVPEMLAAAGKVMMAGQEVRMVDVPADAGAGHGLFEALHGRGEAGELAADLLKGGLSEHGTAGRAFVEWLAARLQADADTFLVRQGELLRDFLSDFLPLGADPQVRSVAHRFAIIALGGELATEAGITGWPARTAWNASGTCFEAWLEERGSPMRSREEIEAWVRIRDFIAKHGQARFQPWPRGGPVPGGPPEQDGPIDTDPGGPPGPPSETRAFVNRAGWRRWVPEPGGRGAWHYYFNATAWSEALSGLDIRAAARSLFEADYLLSRTVTGDGKVKWSRSYSVAGEGQHRLYEIAPGILAADDTGDGGGSAAPNERPPTA